MPRVFISHSTKDRGFVERELLPLLEEHGIEAWYAPDDIDPTTRWERSILGGLEECDWFLLVMSPRAATSEWVRDEVAWAISHRDGKIVPVMLETCDPYAFHIRLPRIQHIDFRSHPENARQRLLAIWGATPTAKPARRQPAQTVGKPRHGGCEGETADPQAERPRRAARTRDFERAVPVLEPAGPRGRQAVPRMPRTPKRQPRRNSALPRSALVGGLIAGTVFLAAVLLIVILASLGSGAGKTDLNGLALGMKFVTLPKGTFWMGRGGGKPGDEQVPVPLEEFQIGTHEVTQGQWKAIMGGNPSWFSRKGGGKGKVAKFTDAELDQFPVENVCWDDPETPDESVKEFIKRLNARGKGSGWVYRLPTEAEWEYAARAGATSKEECSFDFYFDDGPTNNLSADRANFDGNFPYGNAPKLPNRYLERTERVGSYRPNKLGIYDMAGNVWEWCEDTVAGGPSRVRRGGCWNYGGVYCRAGDRLSSLPARRSNELGFRLARSPSGK